MESSSPMIVIDSDDDDEEEVCSPPPQKRKKNVPEGGDIKVEESQPSASSSLHYKELVNIIYEEMAIATTKLIGKNPNDSTTSFLACYKKLPRTKTSGTSLFGNLYTRGSLYLTHKEYREVLLPAYIKDVESNKVTAWSEFCESEYGIRCFFEIDYRSFVRLPTEDEMKHHVLIAWKLVREVTGADKDVGIPCSCRVAKCSRKLKYPKNGDVDNESSSSEIKNKPKLAIGLHIVFSEVVFSPEQLRQLALTLDVRITEDNAFFAGVVDAASIRKNSANLRPLYAYRLDECGGCYPQRTAGNKKKPKKSKFVQSTVEWCNNKDEEKKTSSKKHIGDFACLDQDIMYDSDSEEDVPPLLGNIRCQSAGCSDGKKIASPSIYTPWILIDSQGKEFDSSCMTVREWILDMSIIPEDFKPTHNNYTSPLDAPSVDLPLMRPCATVVFRSETDLIHQKQQSKTGVVLTPQSHQIIFQLVKDIIRGVLAPVYRNILPHTIHYNKKTNSLFVNVKGTGCLFCSLVNREHANNRVYFILKLNKKQRDVVVECYDSTCKSKINQFKEVRKAKQQKKTKSTKSVQVSKPPKVCLDKDPLTVEDTRRLEKMTSAIPLQLAAELKKILGIRHLLAVSDMSFMIPSGPFKKQETSGPHLLFEKKENGHTCLVNLVYDKRTSMYVPPEEIVIPVHGKRISVENLNPKYFWSDESRNDSSSQEQKNQEQPDSFQSRLDRFEALLMEMQSFK